MFYPDVKPHISPSAFANWHTQRSLFVRSYFQGKKTPENAAMKAGKKIHALIEGGFLEAPRFDIHEQDIVVVLPNGVKVLGRPDSYQKNTDAKLVNFVDYKTGKNETWTAELLARDLKMRLTAWLVLQENPQAETVRGILQWIETKWDEDLKEIVPTGRTVPYEYLYEAEELRTRLEPVLLQTIEQVNAAYEEFLALPVGDFVQEADVQEYAALEAEIANLEKRQGEIKQRIGEQLSFSGRESFEHDLGTFYFKVTKTYEHPKDLKVSFKDLSLTLADADQIAATASAIKKNWELENEPVNVSKTISFRPKRKKKNA